MSYFKARVFYGILLALSLMLMVTISNVLIDNNRAKMSSNEYHRVMECVAKDPDNYTEDCIRMLV